MPYVITRRTVHTAKTVHVIDANGDIVTSDLTDATEISWVVAYDRPMPESIGADVVKSQDRSRRHVVTKARVGRSSFFGRLGNPSVETWEGFNLKADGTLGAAVKPRFGHGLDADARRAILAMVEEFEAAPPKAGA